MKKAFLLFVLLFLTIGISTNNAQFKLGVTPYTGLNFNIHSGSDLQESGSGVGFLIGAQADMSFNESIGLLAGFAFYDNRSGSYSESGTTSGVQYDADVDVSLSYFQIEALFRYKLPSNIYFVFGPELGFNEESEVEVEVNYPQYNQSTKSKQTLKNTQTRFELKAGAGYEIPLSRNIDLVPQITFGYGLSNVIEDVKWHIMTFQAQVGVKFTVL